MNQTKCNNYRGNNSEFVYTGSQVENMTFSDAKKKGDVSSGDIVSDMQSTTKEFLETASEAVKDVSKISAKNLRKFSKTTSNAAYNAANTFVTAVGSAALSAAASAAKNLNATASSTTISENQNEFVYTGRQINEELTFVQSEDQDIQSKDPLNRPKQKLFDVVVSGSNCFFNFIE